MWRLIFPILFLVFVEYYSFLSIRVGLADANTLVRRALYALWAVPPVTLIFSIIYSRFASIADWSQTFRTYFFAFVFIIFIACFLGACVYFLDDVRRFGLWFARLFQSPDVAKASRSKFLGQAAIFAAAVPFSVLSYGVIRNAYRYKLHEVKIPIKNLPASLEGFKIIQLSDIHAGSFALKEPIKNAIDIINQQQADIVCFTGDLVNSRADEFKPFVDIFKDIKAKEGVFAILGNHDYARNKKYRESNFQTLHDMYEDMNWTFLRNQHVSISRGEHRLSVIGVENFSTKPYFPKTGDIKKALEGEQAADVRVLLSHDPTHWDAKVLTDHQDIDLTLSGHTHGFQFGVEIPGIKWSPAQWQYPRWAGLYTEGLQHLYVNRGFGCLGYPGRVGILPEISLLTLTRA